MLDVRKIIPLLPVALFFALVFNYHLGQYTPYDTKRILELLLISWCAILLLFNPPAIKFPYYARLLILATFFSGFLSSYFAPLPQMALLEVALYFLLFCCALFIATQKQDQLLITIIFMSIMIYELIFCYYFYLSLSNNWLINYYPLFMNKRFLAQFLTWTLPLATLPLFFIRQKAYSYLCYLIAGIWWAIAIVNSAKGMFLGLILGTIIAGIIFRKNIKKWLTTQIPAIIIGTILYLIFLTQITGLSPIKGSVLGRLPLWQQAITMIIKHPLLGVGPMHFSYYHNPIAAHPHNSILLIGAEWGLPALIGFMVLLIWGLISWSKKFRHSNNAIIIALTVSFISALLHSLVSGIIVMPLSQVMFAMILGWMLGCYYE